MECPYCTGSTHVTNSRPTAEGQHIWRRRACKACTAVFTTREQPDSATTLLVYESPPHNPKTSYLAPKPNPFSRDRLFISIHSALDSSGLGAESVDVASELTQTALLAIAGSTPKAKVSTSDIAKVTRTILGNYSPMAALTYSPKHLSADVKKSLAKKLR